MQCQQKDFLQLLHDMLGQPPFFWIATLQCGHLFVCSTFQIPFSAARGMFAIDRVFR
jgi:hypothetical protein